MSSTATVLDPHALAERIASLADGEPRGMVVVALSGGADSSTLLHLLARGPLKPRLQAVHCDHGLQPSSAAWADRCAALCARFEVPFEVVRLLIDARSPAGLEAAARSERYAALAERLGPDDLLLTAHHADDQAETFLLMALRGSGIAGLAAMPEAARLGRGRHLRPLLGVRRAELVAHAKRHALEPIEDPSNADLARDRNRIRHAVLPQLAPRWPDAADALGRAAAWCGEAVGLLAEHADEDLVRLVDARSPHRLAAAPLAALSAPRSRNALRRWLARLELPPPPATAIERVLAELLPAPRDGRARVDWPGGWIAKHREHLFAGTPLTAFEPEPLRWDGRRPLELPGGGVLALEPGLEPEPAPDRGPVPGGVSCLALDHLGRHLEVRFRVGAESIRPAGSAHHRTLKKLLSERGVLPWMRGRLPLLFVDGELAAVPGVCVAEGHASPRGSPGLAVVWRGHPPLH